MIGRKYKLKLSTLALLGLLCANQADAGLLLDIEEKVLDARVRLGSCIPRAPLDNIEYGRRYLQIAEQNYENRSYYKAIRNVVKAIDIGGQGIRGLLPMQLQLLVLGH